MRRPLLLALAVACGGGCDSSHATTASDAPTGGSADAPVGLTSCGAPPATTAPATLTLTGTVTDGSVSQGPVADATVTAFGGGVARGSAQTEIGGVYQLSVTTGGVPVDYLTFTKAGSLAARYYPRTAIAHSTSIRSIALFSSADAAAYIAMFGVAGAGGAAVITLVDCNDTPPADATASASSGTVKYLHADGSTTGAATDASGVAVVLDMTTGAGTIDALAGGEAYRTLTIAADPAYLAYGVISPK